jgi:hypothetical protein
MAASIPTSLRLRPVIIAYLDEIATVGTYGKGRSGVMRRFIENGVARLVEKRVIEKRNAADFGETPEDDDEDD